MDEVPINLELFLLEHGIVNTEKPKTQVSDEGRDWTPIINVVFDEDGEPNF